VRNFVEIAQTSRDMVIFRFSKSAAAAILEFQILEISTVETLKIATLRPHAKFCRNRSNRGQDMAIFQDDGRRHLGFSNFADFNGRNAQDSQTATPYQILLKSVKPRPRYGDFSKMAAVRHLGCVMRVFGPPTKGIWWSLSLCKICLESIQ